jgi:nucleoside-diphosphate-sugar epimerase
VDSIEGPRVTLLLGGTGFIGRNLVKRLQNVGDEVYIFNRQMNSIVKPDEGSFHTLSQFFADRRNLRIVNLIKNATNASEDEIVNANFLAPLSILTLANNSQCNLSWVQLNSYYQFRFWIQGVDKDLYSKSRRQFSERLEEIARESKTMNSLEIYLPHVYGPGEMFSRLFATLRHCYLLGKRVELASGLQYLPIIEISDCTQAIVQVLESFVTGRIYIEPESQATVQDYCFQIECITGSKLNLGFNMIPDRENEFYEPIECPLLLKSWRQGKSRKYVEYVTGGLFK